MLRRRYSGTSRIKGRPAVHATTARSKSGRFSKAVIANMQSFLLKNFKKKNIAFAAVVLAIALSVPYIFATAANTNEVTVAANLSTPAQATASPSVSVQSTPMPTETGGTLTSELTVESEPSASPSASETPAPSASKDPAADSAYSVISVGMTDPFVAMIQQRLMDLGYMDQDDPTTLYGPITSQAITQFQSKNGLPKDGIAGVQTQSVLFSNSANPYVVDEGDSGPDVQNIQDRLVELGYQVDDTGYYGTDTIKAIQYFQRMNGLSSDGTVGDNTRQTLFSENAEPSLEYTAAQKAASGKSSDAGSGNSGSASTGSSKSSDNGSAASGTPAPTATPKPAPKPSSTPAPPAPPANSSKVEAFISAAMSELGKPYVLGGKGPNVFDCSGLVYYALKASGNGIPYMTSYGWGGANQYTRINSMKDLQRGDVVCERGHVGIYLGNGQIVNASSSNGKMIVSTNVFSSSYWVGHFVCGRRVF